MQLRSGKTVGKSGNMVISRLGNDINNVTIREIKKESLFIDSATKEKVFIDNVKMMMKDIEKSLGKIMKIKNLTKLFRYLNNFTDVWLSSKFYKFQVTVFNKAEEIIRDIKTKQFSEINSDTIRVIVDFVYIAKHIIDILQNLGITNFPPLSLVNP